MSALLYLVALPPRKDQQANAGCWKCRGLLVASMAMRKVRSAVESVFTCAACIPEDKGQVLLTLATVDDAFALEERAKN